MHTTVRRIAAILAAATLATTVGTNAFAARRLHLEDVMTGLACVESSGRFTALNERTGAYGKYQIMPRNWVAWSGRYLGNRWAKPTPRNQEYVAAQRIADLRALDRSWRSVAHWWLTGNADPEESLWSRGSSGYVNRVMAIASAAASPRLADLVPDACFPMDFRQPTIRTEPFPQVRVTGGAVHIRRAAGYEFGALAVARRGDRLAVLDRGRDARGKRWLYVGLSDGRTGWIAGWLTKPGR